MKWNRLSIKFKIKSKPSISPRLATNVNYSVISLALRLCKWRKTCLCSHDASSFHSKTATAFPRRSISRTNLTVQQLRSPQYTARPLGHWTKWLPSGPTERSVEPPNGSHQRSRVLDLWVKIIVPALLYLFQALGVLCLHFRNFYWGGRNEPASFGLPAIVLRLFGFLNT